MLELGNHWNYCYNSKMTALTHEPIEVQCKSLGKLVALNRKKSGLTQQEAGTLAGIGKTAVFDIEHGKPTVQLDTVLKLFRVLNIRLTFVGPFSPESKT